MSIPYLNRGESIVMTTHRVDTGSAIYDVILTNERLIFMDSRYTRFEPRIIVFPTIVSIKGGRAPAGEPAIILALEEASDISGSATINLVFSQQYGEQRKDERDLWVRKIIELVVEARERRAEPDVAPSTPEKRGMHPTIRRWIAPEPVPPRTSVATPPVPPAGVVEMSEDPGSPRFTREEEITGPGTGDNRVTPVEPDAPGLAETEPVTDAGPAPLSFPVLARSALHDVSQEDTIPHPSTPLTDSDEKSILPLTEDTVLSALHSLQPIPEVTEPPVTDTAPPTEEYVLNEPHIAPAGKTGTDVDVAGGDHESPDTILPETDRQVQEETPGQTGDTSRVSGPEMMQQQGSDILLPGHPDEDQKKSEPVTSESPVTIVDEPVISGTENELPHGIQDHDHPSEVLPEPGEGPLPAAPGIPEISPPAQPGPSRQMPQLPPEKHSFTSPVIIGIVALLVLCSAIIIITWSPQGPGNTGPSVEIPPAITHVQPLPEVTGTPESGVWIEVTYTGPFSGTIGNPGFLRQVSGTGNTTSPVIMTDNVVQAVIHKQDYSAEPLAVRIFNNSRLLSEKQVTAPMGEVNLLIDTTTASIPGGESLTDDTGNRSLLGNGSLIYY
jgi:hypothetical protein